MRGIRRREEGLHRRGLLRRGSSIPADRPLPSRDRRGRVKRDRLASQGRGRLPAVERASSRPGAARLLRRGLRRAGRPEGGSRTGRDDLRGSDQPRHAGGGGVRRGGIALVHNAGGRRKARHEVGGTPYAGGFPSFGTREGRPLPHQAVHLDRGRGTRPADRGCGRHLRAGRGCRRGGALPDVRVYGVRKALRLHAALQGLSEEVRARDIQQPVRDTGDQAGQHHDQLLLPVRQVREDLPGGLLDGGPRVGGQARDDKAGEDAPVRARLRDGGDALLQLPEGRAAAGRPECGPAGLPALPRLQAFGVVPGGDRAAVRISARTAGGRSRHVAALLRGPG